MIHALLVFLGGGLGALARHGAVLGVARLWPGRAADPATTPLPIGGTLAVNVIGCLLIGLAWGRLGLTMRDEARMLLVIGFLGGFTTFSAIGWESFSLVSRGQTAIAAVYVVATLVLGLSAVWLGHAIGVRMSAG